jgi:hypothetical protein
MFRRSIWLSYTGTALTFMSSHKDCLADVSLCNICTVYVLDEPDAYRRHDHVSEGVHRSTYSCRCETRKRGKRVPFHAFLTLYDQELGCTTIRSRQRDTLRSTSTVVRTDGFACSSAIPSFHMNGGERTRLLRVDEKR